VSDLLPENYPLFAYMFVLTAAGLALLLYPHALLRWLTRRQSLSDDSFAIGFARFVGGCFLLCNALFLLEMWVSANPQ